MQRLKKTKIVFALALLCFGVTCFGPKANAAIFDNRSLSLTNVTAGATANNIVRFNFITNNSVGSLEFQYCTSPLQELPCTKPAGLDASSATLAAQSGETGFVIFSQNSNTIILGRAPAVTGTEADSYTLDNVKNPSAVGSFYLRISSYASSDGTGPILDFGGTVGDITQGVTITTEVPPILDFCVGISIPGQCNTATGNFLDLGNFQTTSTALGTSQFMVGTNAMYGYAVTVNGNTMTSGNNIIPNQTTPAVSKIGQSQFGINLRSNSTPQVGADPSGGSGTPAANYDSPNLFLFNSGDTIASDSYVSDLEKYTVSYIVNINKNEPIGIYNTTLTYIVSATF